MLTHRRCLRADHLSLDSRGNSFALIQRQAERLRNRPILPLYSSHLDLGRWSACLGHKFHPPNQLPHSAVSLLKARSLAFKNLQAPHDFACSQPLAPSSEACRALIERERASGPRLIPVGNMRRFDPAYLDPKSAYDFGPCLPRVGRPVFASQRPSAGFLPRRLGDIQRNDP